MVTRIDEEILLSDGESLSLATWDRLKELQGNSNKLASKLGRSQHYSRKNRSALDQIGDDLRKVDQEIARRRALTTFSFCGLEFQWAGATVSHDGKNRIYILKCANPLTSQPWSDQTLYVSEDQLRECLDRGAIQNKATDPCTPWKVLDEEP